MRKTVNTSSRITILLTGIAATLFSLWYGQNNGLLPVAASEDASQVDGIFSLMMTVATGLFLLIQGALIFSAIKFRRRKGDETDGPPIAGNVPLEIAWTAIPTVMVLLISVYSFDVYNTMGGLDREASQDPGPQQVSYRSGQHPGSELLAFDPGQKYLALGVGASPQQKEEPEEPLPVEVNGIQYAWIFTYPDTGVVSGELHLPVGRQIDLKITAGDVLHAFWLPEFRLKQDAVPGRETQLRFEPNRVGEYSVVCAELCGAYHGVMKTTLHVQTPEEYEHWSQEQQIAQADKLENSVAATPNSRSASEFLAPYAERMGVESQTLEQLKASPTASASN